MTHDLSRYAPVWRAAEPYMHARKNDVHIPLSFHWALRLPEHFPEADRKTCLLAILLHDIGWYSIDMERIITEGFRRTNILQSDVRYMHEAEGVRLGSEVLRATLWSEATIAAVCEIIDGYDTTRHARSPEDASDEGCGHGLAHRAERHVHHPRLQWLESAGRSRHRHNPAQSTHADGTTTHFGRGICSLVARRSATAQAFGEVMTDLGLAGKRVIVTGAAGFLGRAVRWRSTGREPE